MSVKEREQNESLSPSEVVSVSYSLFIDRSVLYFIGVVLSVYNCGLTLVLLKRHLIDCYQQ